MPIRRTCLAAEPCDTMSSVGSGSLVVVHIAEQIFDAGDRAFFHGTL